MRNRYHSLAMTGRDLVFGKAAIPVVRDGLAIGGGDVLPEIKFTLPSMRLEAEDRAQVHSIYSEIIEGVCRRAVELKQQGIIVEFELLPPMTLTPTEGEAITRLLKETLEIFRADHGLRSLLRATPVDIREQHKPPKRRTGTEVGLLFESFRRCAEAGADLLSIESTGGKEVTDPAIMAADVRGVLFGTAVLGSADMEFLWERIVGIAHETNTIPAGDTACGIGNTAMILADQGYIPRVFAAVVRAITAVRSLVAYEVGARGPGKDCGYENAFLKAITGLPMSLEGKSAACAHFSVLGNIAGAYADLWSNESVQNVKLLSGMAPVVSMEQLIYDCRLFNVAARNGRALDLRDWLVQSDASLDPQAYLFQPPLVAELAREIASEEDDYFRAVRAAGKAAELLEQGIREQKLEVIPREREWLLKITREISSMPRDRTRFVEEEKRRWKEYVEYSEYGLEEVKA